MTIKQCAEIRSAFLDYYATLSHTIVPSSSLIPGNDPTLLFTNAGMVQFKDLFLGLESCAYTRAVSSQRCIRAGGKHNDLENVGYTARHHTFFEMLGNFSFGDYFKRDAIHYAWNFLTQVLKLPREKLWITVYQNDDEAADIWIQEIGIDPNRLSRCGEKDNFWSMGDTGPCGPCSEIFYDHGPQIWGGPPGSPEADGDRYIEIWNLVFMQFNRDQSGQLTPLPKPSVDTGMGLERIAAVLQGVHNNYEIDIFAHLIQAIAKIANVADHTNTSLRVIADHIRSCAFLVVDGIVPSNEGRGYVLRRIMRRAIRHGHKLGINEAFFHRLVKPLVDVMGAAYPELARKQTEIEKILLQEEQQFSRTLANGMALLESALSQLKGKVIPGDVVFKLYDTYGFPSDLTADIARERELTIDEEQFNQLMNEQRAQSKQASQFSMTIAPVVATSTSTCFTGYGHDATAVVGVGTVLALQSGDQAVTELTVNQEAIVVLDQTPFYAESGGQVGDVGYLRHGDNGDFIFQVTDTKKQGSVFLHYGRVIQGTLHKDDKVRAMVDHKARLATARNHSATHLLHAALQQVLGDHVTQKGSLVDPMRLRFDFSHPQAIAGETLREIEDLVNEKILANLPVNTALMTPEAAKAAGAMALFGEKYGDEVRVLSMGDFSKELCGGTHVKNTGEIGSFKIILETSVAAGVRRLEAITGLAVIEHSRLREAELLASCQFLKLNKSSELLSRVTQLVTDNVQLTRELQATKSASLSNSTADLLAQATVVQGVKLLVTSVADGLTANELRQLLDQLRDKIQSGVVVLASVTDQKINIAAGVTADLIDRVHAGKLIAALAEKIGGKGGGRADMAQAGGSDIKALPAALAGVADWLIQSV